MNIGLLASPSLNEFRVNTLKPFFVDESISIKAALIDSRPKQTIKQKLKKNLKLGRGGYILVMAIQSLFSNKRFIVSTKSFCEEHGIQVIETTSPYSIEFIKAIENLNLDVLLLVGGFGIVKEPLLKVTPLGVLSYHHGDMKKYRGMPPALWELYNNESEMGVTVQILAPGVDCGIPVEEKAIPIHRKDNVKSLQERAFRESEHMLYDALKKISDPTFKPVWMETLGKVYTLPNLRQWISLNLKLFLNRKS